MKMRIFFGAMVILLLSFNSAVALEPTMKLGYGFAPGLMPGKDYVAGQLIVGIQEGMGTREIKQSIAASGVQISKEIEGALLLQFPSEEGAVGAVSGLLRLPEVAFVERNGFMRIPPKPQLAKDKNCGKCNRTAKGELKAQSVSSDDGTGYQWHLTVIRKTASDLPALSSTPPTVAVIDTGVDYTHEDLENKVVKGKNTVANNMDPMDDNGHGTHCAGVIGAEAGNGDFGEGVCPNCKILAVKVLRGDGTGTFIDVAEGMKYARTYSNGGIPPVKVISMSVGGPSSALIASEVLAIKNAGKILVAAAGNDNTSDTTDAFPGADPNTSLRVMATDQVDCRAYFSNFSPASNVFQYNIAAPGWDIYSTLPDLGFGSMSGTSMATPIVAGAAALVWGQLPTLKSYDLVSRIRSYGENTKCGFPAETRRVDVRKAILGTSETAIVGMVRDPFTGKAPSSSSDPTTVNLRSGTTVLATDGTDRSGSYEMTGLSAGKNRDLQASKSGYISTRLRYPIWITAGVVAGPFIDALPQSRGSGYGTIILDWKRSQPVESVTGCTGSCLGWEFDLFVKMPSGDYIYWDNKGDLMASPYIYYPRDSYDDYLPMETIVIGNSAADGVYKVFVDRYPYYSEVPSLVEPRLDEFAGLGCGL